MTRRCECGYEARDIRQGEVEAYRRWCSARSGLLTGETIYALARSAAHHGEEEAEAEWLYTYLYAHQDSKAEVLLSPSSTKWPDRTPLATAFRISTFIQRPRSHTQ